MIIPERLVEISSKSLGVGAHESVAEGMCIMEAVSYIAGEPWSDHPACVCPVIAVFLRNWNDALPDGERTRLLAPLIPIVVGSHSTEVAELRRGTMAGDWLVRVHTPAWLRLAGLTSQAEVLAGLPEIIDFEQCPSLMPILYAVRDDSAAAVAAAGTAAGTAARDVAWTAARDVAWTAAVAAAGTAVVAAAWDVAWTAAGTAVVAAAWDVAWTAARDALKTTTSELQTSAVDLVHRMLGVQP